MPPANIYMTAHFPGLI